MSDPVTNVEIEDVLSSIRRLVAEGDGRRQPASSTPPSRPPRPKTAERFVLTPSLRVDNDAPRAKADNETPPAVAPMAKAQSEQPATDSVEQFAYAGPDKGVAATAFDTNAPEKRASRKVSIAELEAAVIAQEDEWEPDGTGTPMELSWASAGFRGDVEVEDAEISPGADMVAGEVSGEKAAAKAAKAEGHKIQGGEDRDEDGVSIADIDLSATPVRNFADEDTPPVDVSAALFTFRHKRPDTSKPAAASTPRDDTEKQDAVSDDRIVDDLNEDEMIGGDDLGPDPEELLASYMADDPIIDEDALREMVRQIVREELQGDMGKRITRVVRKMVRQEINRVLSSQDYS